MSIEPRKPVDRNRRRMTWPVRGLLVLGGVAAALVVAEVGLRCVLPAESFIRGHEWKFWRQNSDVAKKAFVADSELGYHPRLGTKDYDQYGALIIGSAAQLIAKTAGRSRILLLGDSVTARRSIENALKLRFGETEFEFWNCGVEGYNTYQETRYYRRFCRDIRADHVVLTLHNNDYESTPVAFYDDEGRMAVFSPDRPSTGLNPWLYQRSYIYRVWLSWKIESRAPHDDQKGAELIRRSLEELQALLVSDGVRLTVFVLPPCREGGWEEHEKRRHQTSLAILADLGISHFDLATGLSLAIKDQVSVQENQGDTLHPSAEVARYFVKQAVLEGFSL